MTIGIKYVFIVKNQFMFLQATGPANSMKWLTYSTGNLEKEVYERSSLIPSKIISKEGIEIPDEIIKKRLEIDDLTPLFEERVQGNNHRYYALYRKFIESLDFFVNGRERIA